MVANAQRGKVNVLSSLSIEKKEREEMKVAATASTKTSSKNDVFLFTNSNFSRMLDQTLSFLYINALKKISSHLIATQIFYFILHLLANLLPFDFFKVTKRNRDIFEHRYFFSSVRFVLC